MIYKTHTTKGHVTTHDDVQKSHDSQVRIDDLHSSLGPEILLLGELWR